MKVNIKSWFSIIEAVISIVVLSILTLWVLQTIQSGKNLRYIQKAKQETASIHEIIIWDIESKLRSAKSIQNKWSSSFSANARTAFLSNFPGNWLSSVNTKSCYSLSNTGNWFNYTLVSLAWGRYLNLDTNSQIDTSWKTTVNSNGWTVYPTVVCLMNWFEYIDESSSSKDTISGPILFTIHSQYFGQENMSQTNSEKVVYFNE